MLHLTGSNIVAQHFITGQITKLGQRPVQHRLYVARLNIGDVSRVDVTAFCNFIGSELPGFTLTVSPDVIEEDSSEVELVECIHHTLQHDTDVVANIVHTGA